MRPGLLEITVRAFCVMNRDKIRKINAKNKCKECEKRKKKLKKGK